MSDIREDHGIRNIPLLNDDTGRAAARHMPRPALGVETEVPVDPAVGPCIQVADQLMRIPSCIQIVFLRGRFVRSLSEHGHSFICLFPSHAAALRQHQIHVGEFLPCHLDILEVVSGIPVKGNAADHRHGLLIQHGERPFEHTLLIVIPDIKLDLIRKSCFHKFRPQIIPQEFLLLCCLPDTAVPRRRRDGLILHRHHRNRDTLIQISPHIFCQISGPGVIIFRFQRTAKISGRLIIIDISKHPAIHGRIVLRPCRRRLPLLRRGPGGQEHGERFGADFHRLFDHRNDIFPVPVQCKARKIRVLQRILDCLILPESKIAAVDGRPDKFQPVPLRTEQRFQNLTALFFPQRRQKIGT